MDTIIKHMSEHIKINLHDESFDIGGDYQLVSQEQDQLLAVLNDSNINIKRKFINSFHLETGVFKAM